MSNIETLIETVRAEGLQTRDTLSTDFTWFEYMNDNLVTIRESIVSIQERIFTFFDEEQARFDEAQRELKAARRAEAERLKEAGTRGFTTPAKTSDGHVAETPSQGGGLLSGLGLAGLVGALGAAVAGYFAGLTTALAKTLPSPKALTGPIADFFGRVKSLAVSFGKLFAGTGRIKDFDAFGDFAKTIRNFGEAVRKITTPVKNFFAPLGELTKLLPSGGTKFAEGIKAFGSKLAGIFNVFAKIAVPLTAIIGTVKGIVKSFDEFGEDTSLLEKFLITFKNVVRELFSAFVTSLLELGKDIVSWVAGALGFTAIEKYLDSFDIDQKFREIFDGAISGIIEFFNKTKDALYKAARAIGIVEVDPEAEARIAAREVGSAEEDLAESQTNVQRAQAAVDAATNVNERERAEEQLESAIKVRDARVEDLQEAQASAAERRTAAGLPATPATQTPQAASQPEPAQPQYNYPVIDPVTNEVIDTFATAEEANQAAITSGGVMGDPIISTQSTATSEQLQEVMVPSRELRSTTIETVPGQPGQAGQPAASADQLQEVVVPSRPRVEPLSNLTNVTNIDQATTAMQAAISSVIPSEAGDLNLPGQEGGALSPAGIMGAGLGSIFEGVKSLTSLPVAQASQEVAAAKDKPQVVALSGGSNSQVVNNTTNQQTLNMGSMSARSQDISNQRRADLMMA